MSNAHTDAPTMDEPARALYRMVREKAPVADIRKLLHGEFNIAARLMTVPTYKQANGFWTFKLAGEGGDRLLRMHFWPKNMKRTKTSGLHDHVFDFTSLVLAGDAPMINSRFEIKPDPASNLAVYEVEYLTPEEHVVRKLGDHFSPVTVGRESVPCGAYYDLPAGEFHTSHIEGDAEAITLMATQLNPAVKNPRFVAPGDIAVQSSYPRIRLDQGERAFVAQRLRANV